MQLTPSPANPRHWCASGVGIAAAEATVINMLMVIYWRSILDGGVEDEGYCVELQMGVLSVGTYSRAFRWVGLTPVGYAMLYYLRYVNRHILYSSRPNRSYRHNYDFPHLREYLMNFQDPNNKP